MHAVTRYASLGMRSSANRWTRLAIAVPEEASDAVSAVCIELGAPGVVTGQRDLKRASPQRLLQRRTTRLEAYFPPEIERCDLKKRLSLALLRVAESFPAVRPDRARLTPYAPRDYTSTIRERFPPLRIGKRLLVSPPWHHPEPRGRVVLRIEPGQAFGTGHHATTRSCLLEIERACSVAPPARGLDVGSGSGVLAVAMRALGVRRVVAVDTDPVARRVTAEAVTVNRCGPVRVVPSLGLARGLFDLIVANLFAHLLVALAPRLAARLAPGGRLVVSGLLARQEREVRAAFAQCGLRVARPRTLSGWSTITCQARTRPALVR
jgi:ribosomal protein L11 methyltransferase